MSDEELEKVAGGDVREMRDLVMEMAKNPVVKGIGVMGSHIPLGNIPASYEIEKVLEDSYGIEAHISVGIGGTGILSGKNTYKNMVTGEEMTHKQVMFHIARVNRMQGC